MSRPITASLVRKAFGPASHIGRENRSAWQQSLRFDSARLSHLQQGVYEYLLAAVFDVVDGGATEANPAPERFLGEVSVHPRPLDVESQNGVRRTHIGLHGRSVAQCTTNVNHANGGARAPEHDADAAIAPLRAEWHGAVQQWSARQNVSSANMSRYLTLDIARWPVVPCGWVGRDGLPGRAPWVRPSQRGGRP